MIELDTHVRIVELYPRVSQFWKLSNNTKPIVSLALAVIVINKLNSAPGIIISPCFNISTLARIE
jgi:hypothetical protein